ncbi:porin family protein [Winogradskyella eximia]|uniref:porin family protein n=1 Tax=Winogradskyella eximia TaxID=262006 RepID=UPI0024920E9A|nr:porin family protein [Winogradskyella eximia]
MNFKKLTLVIITLFGMNAFAQKNIDFGAKVGVNFAGFRSGESTFTSRIGFNIGAMSELKISDLISIQGEIVYNRRGGNFSVSQNLPYPNNHLKTHYVTTLDYIDIPIQGKIYFLKKLSVDFGPQIGFLMNDKVEIDDGISNDQNGPEVEFDNIQSIDFALTGGFSYKFESNLIIQTRYNFGLTKVFKDSKYKNSMISLSLGYYF